MKKILFLVLSIALAFGVNAQNQRRSGDSSFDGSKFFSTERTGLKPIIGIRGGVNFSGINFKLNNSSDWDDYFNNGFKGGIGEYAGISVDIPIFRSLYINSGVFWTAKEFKFETYEAYRPFTAKFTPRYLEIPVLASYRYNFTDNIQMQINFGPYFAYGITGKVKIKYDKEYTSKEDDVFNVFDPKEIGSVDPEIALKRFDMGLHIGGGLTFKKIYFGVFYEFGLTNSYTHEDKEDQDNMNIKTHGFVINAGYNF